MDDRRSFDLPSLVTGLLALIGSGLYLVDAAGAVEVDEVVALAALLIALGVVGGVRSAVSLLRGRRPERG